MLFPEVLRTLDLAAGEHPHGRDFLGAASSLVCIGRHAYVIADDEHHLGHFALHTPIPQPVQLLRLFDGTLPTDKRKRKKAKPDLESLALLPALVRHPHGALLALGSGSKPTRNRAVMIALDAGGFPTGPVDSLDLTDLYAPLREQFGDLNIEGALVANGMLYLLNRGNKTQRRSARIAFDFSAVLASWFDGSPAPMLLAVQDLGLGAVDGVPLSLTDAVALDDGSWAFCAVAESTGDSYQDGACVGSVVGVIAATGHLQYMQRLLGDPKVEGIALDPEVLPDAGKLVLLLVTDADDPEQASQLLRVTVNIMGSGAA